MRIFLGALTAWALSATLASAQMMGVLGGPFAAASSYTGPGDATTFTAWYGFRAYSAADAVAGGLAANLRNIATSEQCDFPVTSAGVLGVAKNCTASSNGDTAAVFCAESASSCAVTELYDHTGGGRHLLQTTTADQPAFISSCINSLPCASFTSGTISFMSSANFTPASGTVSFAGVGNEAVGSGNFKFLAENGTSGGNRIIMLGTTWEITGGTSGTLTQTASAATAHSATAVMAGASSVMAIDGSEATGTATGNTSAGLIAMFGTASQTNYASEVGFTDNVAFSGTIRTNLCHNMRLYYATGGSC